MANGHGELSFYDGRLFKGQFKNNMIDGEGELRFDSETLLKGIWK